MSELSTDLVKEFVTASHFDLDKVKTLLAEHPDLLRVEYDWGAMGGLEDGIGAAAHMGNRPIAEFFLAEGVSPNICVMAMLGRAAEVKEMLTSDPALANARGAHGITVMFHTAMSGKTEIADLLKNAGCKEGFSHALHGAIAFGHENMVAWLLANGVTNVDMPDFENKTPLERATERNQTAIIDMLQKYRAAHPA
jgi:ankyrin repeat protein